MVWVIGGVGKVNMAVRIGGPRKFGPQGMVPELLQLFPFCRAVL